MKWKNNWYLIAMALFGAAVAVFFAVLGENAHIAVHDNLDLFQAQYAMLKNTGTFFTRRAAAPFLGGISRNVLPSEWTLSSFVYLLFPPLAAYEILLFCKVILAMLSFRLLAGRIAAVFGKDEENEEKDEEKKLSATARLIAYGCGFAYGLLPMFPAFGICFSSLPLCLYLFLSYYHAPKKQKRFWLLALFFYPFVSYFSYFGFFILAAAGVCWIVLCIRKRSPELPFLLAVAALAAGYVVLENRLFLEMLFSGVTTIRAEMVVASFPWKDLPALIFDEFLHGAFHNDALHFSIILPVCIAALFLAAAGGAKNAFSRRQEEKEGKKSGGFLLFCKGIAKGVFTSPVFFCIALVFLNCLIQGLYYMEPARDLFEKLIPPLTGFQFGRIVFLNPALWYLAFAFALYGIWMFFRKNVKGKTARLWVSRAAYWGIAAVMVLQCGKILLSATTFNDLYWSVYAEYYSFRHDGELYRNMSYGDFYAPSLFATIKQEIGYETGDFTSYKLPDGDTQGAEEVLLGTGADWSVAYGMHPAVLEYNGIATLDGYLGFYSQAYKERFRKIIEPALAEKPATRVTYDNWGARCYLFPSRQDTVVVHYRTMDEDPYLAVNAEALKDLGCRYVFSRFDLENAAELGLSCIGSFHEEPYAYTIYVYEFK